MTRINRHRSPLHRRLPPSLPHSTLPSLSLLRCRPTTLRTKKITIPIQSVPRETRQTDPQSVLFSDSKIRHSFDNLSNRPTPGPGWACLCALAIISARSGGGGTFARARPSVLRSSFISISVSNSVMHANQEATAQLHSSPHDDGGRREGGGRPRNRRSSFLPPCRRRRRRRRRPPRLNVRYRRCKAGEGEGREDEERTPN